MHKNPTVILAAAAALFLLWPLPARASDPMRGPWDAGGRPSRPAGATGPGSGSADALLIFYRSVISPLSPARCPMTPSCSAYGHESISRFGPLRGVIMTADRLMRCGRDEVRLSPRIWTKEGFRTLDPVAANDLWTRPPAP